MTSSSPKKHYSRPLSNMALRRRRYPYPDKLEEALHAARGRSPASQTWSLASFLSRIWDASRKWAMEDMKPPPAAPQALRREEEIGKKHPKPIQKASQSSSSTTLSLSPRQPRYPESPDTDTHPKIPASPRSLLPSSSRLPSTGKQPMAPSQRPEVAPYVHRYATRAGSQARPDVSYASPQDTEASTTSLASTASVASASSSETKVTNEKDVIIASLRAQVAQHEARLVTIETLLKSKVFQIQGVETPPPSPAAAGSLTTAGRFAIPPPPPPPPVFTQPQNRLVIRSGTGCRKRKHPTDDRERSLAVNGGNSDALMSELKAMLRKRGRIQ